VASRKLSAMLSSTGSLSTESTNATSNVSKYQDDLKKLDDRMQRLLERYSKQFAAMDSIVGQSKSTQTGLTSTFAGLMAMYTNK
jgi:flagellar capping protein FliD